MNRKKRNRQLSCHHRRCRSNGGTDEPRNLSYITRNRHRSWHVLTGNLSPEKIAELINEKYLDPDWKLIAVRR